MWHQKENYLQLLATWPPSTLHSLTTLNHHLLTADDLSNGYLIGPKSMVGAFQVNVMFPRRTGRPLSVTLQRSLLLCFNCLTHVDRRVPIHLRCLVMPGNFLHSPTRVALPSGLSAPRAWYHFPNQPSTWPRPHLENEGVKVVLSEDGDGVVPASTILSEVNFNWEWRIPFPRLLGGVK